MNGFVFEPIVVENTANPGQLQSITDSVPYHKCGQTYFDKDTGKGYVYIKNGSGSALVANTAYAATPIYLSTSGVDWNLQVSAISDEGAGQALIVVVGISAIPSLYYGWVQFKGDVSSLITCTNEDRAVGDFLCVIDGALTITAVSGYTSGVPNTCFAIVTTAQTTSSTTCTTCRLIGRETLAIA